MTPLATLFWLLNLLFDTLGHLSFKAAATVANDVDGRRRWVMMAQNKWIWIGAVAFAFEFVVWIMFLALVPLSLGVLLGSVDIIAIMIGGRIFFGEALTPPRIAAAILIFAGVVLVGVGQA